MQNSDDLSKPEEKICEKLLHLIEDGEADQILSPKFTSGLNELVKNELITLKDDKVLLTAKGRQAKLLGIKAMVKPTEPVQEQNKLSDFSQVPVKPEMNRFFIVILILFLVSIVALFTLMYQ